MKNDKFVKKLWKQNYHHYILANDNLAERSLPLQYYQSIIKASHLRF